MKHTRSTQSRPRARSQATAARVDGQVKVSSRATERRPEAGAGFSWEIGFLYFIAAIGFMICVGIFVAIFGLI